MPPRPLRRTTFSRAVRHQGPGKAWRDADSHTDTEFYANRADGALQCLDYRVGDDGRLVCRGAYPAGSLYVTKTTGASVQPHYGGSMSRIDWRATDGRQTLNQAFANRYDGYI